MENIEEIKEILTEASKIVKPTQDFTEIEQQAEQKFFNSIKGYVNHKNYCNIKKYLNVITDENSKIKCFMLVGEAGIGKSTIVRSILKEKNVKFRVLNSYSTPLEFYKFCYNNRKSHIILDDLNGLYNDEKGVSILRAMINTDDVRLIVYQSTSDKTLDVPSRFIFEGSISILTNHINNNLGESTRNRAICRTLRFTFEEKLDLLFEISKFNYRELKENELNEIINFFKLNVKITTKSFSFRTIEKVIEFYKLYKENWNELALEELEDDENLLIINEIIKNNHSIKKQLEEWTDKTGLGRSSYFLYKQKLVQKSNQSKNPIKK